MTGIMSAYLAASAFGAPERIFDGRRSYYRTVASDTFRPELLVGDLGVRWHLTSLSFKPYPCCRWIHPVLDALTSMRDRADLRLADVDRIDIAGFWELERLFLRYRPRDLVDAQFSLPYACAHVLARTPPGPAWFEESAIDDQAILALADRVHVATDARVEAERLDDPNALRARIEVRLRDGRVLEDERAVAHGHPTDPMTEAEALAKFVILAEPLLGDGSEGLGRAILEADADRSLSGLIEPAFRAVARAGST
jgi:2-methylcitrate dehydratase PrpD